MGAEQGRVEHFGPEWNTRRVVVFHGQMDTHIKTGEDYETYSLARIFTMETGSDNKGEGLAFIPSTYADYDARNHARQREAGSFVALTGDIDKGDHSIKHLEGIVRGFAKEAAWLIYSSPHARPGDMRWRVIIPLSEPLDFDQWCDAQNAFFAYMEQHGCEMDYALNRAAQPVYLPNVPSSHPKTGEALRGEDGLPLHYVRTTTGCNALGLDITTGVIAVHLADIRRQNEADERERERLRAEAQKRREQRDHSENTPIIDDFNRTTSIEQLFNLYGYEQSLRHSEDWRSPQQTSESYATRIMDDKWVSLSASDAGAGLGSRSKSGCFGDAYDLFVFYEHGGDHKAAFRQLYSERRQATITTPTPPQVDTDDPGWTEPPEGPPSDAQPIIEVPEPEQAKELHFIDAFDFDENAIPPRPWVIPGVMLSGYTHMLAAPGGSGKSLFTLQLAIALAKGKAWGTFVPRRKCRTAIINVEDDIDEQRRRLAAARRVMGGGKELSGMIEVTPSPESIVVAGRSPDGKTFRTTPIVEALVQYITERKIDVLIVDPFAETFEGDENDNSEVKWCMKIWRDEIARRTGCVVYLVHHTVKYAGGGAGDANVIRGAGAIVNSTRISATLMPMTQEEADMIGIDQSERHLYVRYDDAKANQSLKTNVARWFQKVSVQLDNGDADTPGDEVGALTPWTPPDAFDGMTTQTINTILDKIDAGMPDGERYTATKRGGSKRWVGDLIMAETSLKPTMVKKIISAWLHSDVLVEDTYQSPKDRREIKGLFAPEMNRPTPV